MNHSIPDPLNAVAQASQPVLEAIGRNFGFVPNLFTAAGASAQALDGLVTLNTNFGETSLSPAQQQVVMLAVSVENGCEYCVAGHTVFARSVGVAEHVIEAVRNDTPIADASLETLRAFAREIVRQRGNTEADALAAFFEAGFDQRQLQDVVLGVVLKTHSNYVAIMLDLPLDPQFESGAWSVTDRAA